MFTYFKLCAVGIYVVSVTLQSNSFLVCLTSPKTFITDEGTTKFCPIISNP